MDLIETRRQNLRIWTAANGTPQAERSLFSQLKGVASFGEKVARRLERDYNMGTGYLDRPVGEGKDAAAIKQGFPQVPGRDRKTRRGLPKTEAHVSADVLAEMNVISEREAQLLNWFRMSTEDSKGIIETVARTIEKAPLSAIVDDQAKSGSTGS